MHLLHFGLRTHWCDARTPPLSRAKPRAQGMSTMQICGRLMREQRPLWREEGGAGPEPRGAGGTASMKGADMIGSGLTATGSSVAMGAAAAPAPAAAVAADPLTELRVHFPPAPASLRALVGRLWSQQPADRLSLKDALDAFSTVVSPEILALTPSPQGALHAAAVSEAAVGAASPKSGGPAGAPAGTDAEGAICPESTGP